MTNEKKLSVVDERFNEKVHLPHNTFIVPFSVQGL